MFTGLIEGIGVVVSSGERLSVSTDLADELTEGDSISVDGACLTIAGAGADRLSFDISPETLRATIASDYKKGTEVNLERPLSLGGRLDGHLVSGHVDCVGRILSIDSRGNGKMLRASCLPGHEQLIVEKGSVALSGISLTVAAIEKGSFSVWLIPQTLARTTSGSWRPGSKVNVEYDILGKYVLRSMAIESSSERLRKMISQEHRSDGTGR